MALRSVAGGVMTTAQDTVERAQRLLHDAGDLILADPLMLFSLARLVRPLLAEIADLDDQLHAALDPPTNRDEVLTVAVDHDGYVATTLERVR